MHVLYKSHHESETGAGCHGVGKKRSLRVLNELKS